MSNNPNHIKVDNKDVAYIKEQLLQQSIKLDKINSILVGDESYKVQGLLDKVDKNSKYIENDKKVKSKVVGGLTVIGVVWTLLLKFWEKIF